MTPNVAAFRAWALVVAGCVGVAYGLIDRNAAVLIAGFSLLGGEPMVRAVNGKKNGPQRPAG